MLVGYARVSTAEQSPSLQQDALTAAGCGRICQIHSDVASRARDARPGLADALDDVREGAVSRGGRTSRR